MKLQERTYREMTINSSQLIIPRETYQRELNPERVRKIVKEFDERVANEPKVSCRNGKYYVFYHRQTNRHCYSRQACAEEIEMLPDGTFKQAEVTSCGLNGGPLKAEGEYEARIACHLFSKKGVYFYGGIKPPKGCHPYFTQTGKDREENGDQYIANFCDGATAGFKYFEFQNNDKISVAVSGKACGEILVKDGLEGTMVATIDIASGKIPQKFTAKLDIENGVKPLYFTYRGKGRLNLLSISFT